MFDAEYERLHVVASGKQTQLIRCRNKSDGSLVVIKTSSTDKIGKESQQLRREFEVGLQASKNAERVIQHYGVILNGDIVEGIVLQNIEGRSLSSIIPEDGFPLRRFLDLAIECVLGLQEIHNNNVVHKDVKPSNMLLTQDDKIIQIDFGCASVLQEQLEGSTTKLQKIYGTLAYLSPEQTGRINRVTDYRTDFYSLGVTFYQFLTGTLPFVDKSVMEMIYNHLAVEPPPLPIKVPQVISDIIIKLLRKDAQERYQSCQGLLYDLIECRKRLVERVENNQQVFDIKWFPLASRDFLNKMNTAKHLYGREKELSTLIDTFERVAITGETEVVFVSGRSGIGKSALVKELQRNAQMKKGYFASGKYDQLDKSVVYSAIIESFSELVKQILTEGNESIQQWGEKLREVVGTNGQILVNLIPEVEEMIGPQAPVSKVSLSESKSRTDLVLSRFVNMMVSNERPLVLFIDDLQVCIFFLQFFLQFFFKSGLIWIALH